MEYFGFASGSSKTGPAFPYMPESAMTNYPSTLMNHPAVPATVTFLNMQTSDARNLVAAVQAWADKSLAILDKPALQAIGVGLSASVCAYGVWRIRRRWNTGIVVCKNDEFQTLEGEPDVSEALLGDHVERSLDIDVSGPTTDITQRQLENTRAKIDDLRFQLNRVEGEKDMLAAEVSMRKKIVAQLQGEIHIERDKRRQAELRMEMMEWENTHLRRLRKEVAVKEGKIDMLEASLKEKEVLNDKLFQENVILPKNVAAARAKEYEVLHAKVQKYELEAVMKRNSEEPYKPSRHGSLTSAIDQIPYDESTGTLETAVQLQRLSLKDSTDSYYPSDWDKSPSSTGSIISPQPYASRVVTQAKTLLYSTTNWSNSMKTSKKNAHGDWCEIKAIKKPLSELRGRDKRKHMEDSESTQQRTVRENEKSLEETRCSNRNNPLTSSKMYSSSQSPSNVENEPGVLGQISSFFGMFNQSGSESGMATILGSPARLADVVSSQSRLWDKSPHDKTCNGCLEDDNNDDDKCCLSDGHSSIFMSASGGSDASDDDSGKAIPRCKQPCTRARSLKRASSSKKTRDLKRNQESSYEEVKAAPKDYVSNEIPSPYEILSGENAAFCRQAAYLNSVTLHKSIQSNEESLANGQKKTHRQGRARQRSRPRKSRSKLTTITPNTPQNTRSACGAKAEKQPSTPVERRDVRLLTAQEGRRNQIVRKSDNTNENSAHSFKAPLETSSAAANKTGDANKNSNDGTDADSEESWIVITPAE